MKTAALIDGKVLLSLDSYDYEAVDMTYFTGCFLLGRRRGMAFSVSFLEE